MDKDLQTIYAAAKHSCAELEFQTGPASPPDLGGVIGYGVSLGAGSIELYQDFGGSPWYPTRICANTRRC